MLIHYVDGVCGSYKTTHALQFAVRSATKFRQPILFVQPTTVLISQSMDTINKMGANVVVRRFDSIACQGAVFRSLGEFMREWDAEENGGCIVFITHRCLWEMPWFPHKSRWNLIIDEIPDVDFEFNFNLPDTGDFAIQSVIQASECGLNTMLKLTPRPEAKAKVDHWARNPGDDDLIKVIQPLFRELTNQHSAVFATRASWQRLGWEGHGQVSIHGWRAPSVCDGWNSVRIMGAFFEQSLLYAIWANLGVEFEPDKQIKVAATRHDETLGKRLTIHYFSERSWSKTLRDKIASADDPLAHVKPIIADIMGDKPFLASMNKDIGDSVLAMDFPNVVRIPAVCHGLNDYRHIDRIAFLSALNNTPGHFSYMDKVFGISADHLKQARANQVAYQSLMRTSLRDADSTAEVVVLVPDIALANWLGDVFPGCKIYASEAPAECKVALGDARKARGCPIKESVLTPVEKNARYNEKKKRTLITKNTLYKVFFVIELSHENSLKSFEVERSGHIDWEDIRTQMRLCHDEVQVKKEDNTLVSGALFDQAKDKDTSKGLGNITAVNGVWLDFDGGALMPDEFARMFTDVRWLLFNSYRNGKDGTTRYRVLFPTKCPMTTEMYHAIWDAIAARIKDFGYFVGSGLAYEKAIKAGRVMPPQSGLDVSKRTANSFFYLPCRAGLGKRYTFWREHWGDDVPVLDPDIWVGYAPLEANEYQVRPPHQNPVHPRLQLVRDRLAAEATQRPDDDEVGRLDREAARVATRGEATNEWRATPEGHGHEGLFRLGRRLKASGLDDSEVRRMLEQEVAYANSPGERRNQIPSIMASLRRYSPVRRAA